jgi:hypothetical protein
MVPRCSITICLHKLKPMPLPFFFVLKERNEDFIQHFFRHAGTVV